MYAIRSYYDLRMCPGSQKDQEPPLGWSLSKSAQANINGYLGETEDMTSERQKRCIERNKLQLEQLAGILRPAGG